VVVVTTSPAERLREAARLLRSQPFTFFQVEVALDVAEPLAAWLDVAANFADYAAAEGADSNVHIAAPLALADALLANRSTT
jgi:hypothetical protein